MVELDNFICENLGLVHSCAKRFSKRGIEYDDLYQAGCMGLIKAANGFDKERGLCFSTYAVPVILGEIKRLFRDGGTIKVSRSLKELSLKAVNTKEKMEKEMGREVSINELAGALSVSGEEIAEALCAAQPVMSLTAQSEDGDTQLDLPTPGVEEQLSDRLDLDVAMAKLSREDANIIKLRYFRGLTQSQTAKLLNMTQVQISRRERKILDTLRLYME